MRLFTKSNHDKSCDVTRSGNMDKMWWSNSNIHQFFSRISFISGSIFQGYMSWNMLTVTWSSNKRWICMNFCQKEEGCPAIDMIEEGLRIYFSFALFQVLVFNILSGIKLSTIQISKRSLLFTLPFQVLRSKSAAKCEAFSLCLTSVC